MSDFAHSFARESSWLMEAFEGGATKRDLSEAYGVTQTHINYIIQRKTWSHV